MPGVQISPKMGFTRLITLMKHSEGDFQRGLSLRMFTCFQAADQDGCAAIGEAEQHVRVGRAGRQNLNPRQIVRQRRLRRPLALQEGIISGALKYSLGALSLPMLTAPAM